MIRGFCNVAGGDGRARLAVATDRGLVEAARLGPAFAALDSTDALIASGLEQQLAQAAQAHGGPFADPASVRLLPAVTRPEKILMVGLNYRRHAAEVGKGLPSMPMLFAKFNNALAAQGEDIALPTRHAEKFDYEAELVIVIGRGGRDLAKAEALSHVFGYCVGNDLSARDLQNATSQYLLGKGIDQFAPLGPWVVPARLAGNPDDLAIRCEVNGETRQSSRTNDLVFDCAELVSFCSRVMTLKPGDLIFTGTPEGVIAGYPPERQRWLRAGDRVVVEIEGLGRLENRLV